MVSDYGRLIPVAIIMPATWTTANLTLQASYDGGTTWYNVYDAYGTEVVFSAAASRFIIIDPATLFSTVMIRFRSGTSSVPVAQGGARIITVVPRDITC